MLFLVFSYLDGVMSYILVAVVFLHPCFIHVFDGVDPPFGFHALFVFDKTLFIFPYAFCCWFLCVYIVVSAYMAV